MQFAIYCLDKPDHLAKRMENRPAHLEYLKKFTREIQLAGPLLADDGQTMIGSLFIVDMPDRAAAEAFSAGDPYRKNGVFASVDIRPFRKALPAG
ncbi:MAG: YciI family protein [Rhodospirillaceae bacterium]|nr:YciI family protein [Rhodospirillaceae bacterium]